MKKTTAFVKIPGVFPVLFAVFIIVFGSSFLISVKKNDAKTDEWFASQLHEFKQNLTSLKELSDQKAALPLLKNVYAKTRASYKRLAVLSEYFNPYETKFLNGPALPRVEEDNPDNILPPRGLQLIEEKLFGDWKNDHAALSSELDFTLRIVTQMENEKDRHFKFRDESVMDAMTASLVRIMALGITGFDSPVAKQSLPEAVASLQGMESIIIMYSQVLSSKDRQSYDSVLLLLKNAKTYLQQHNEFDSFDRLHFISNYINPSYALLTLLKQKTGFYYKEGRRPVNANSPTVFSVAAFNISFFSPDESYQVTGERVALGKKLFFDPILSATNTRSCGSCHKPELAFTDGLAVALAVDEKTLLKRNTPTLWNSVLQTRQFYDSRTDILENQLDEVVHNAEEMKGSLKQSAEDLKKHPVYAGLFNKAYPKDRLPITGYNIANAISSYIRTLTAMNSRFDQFMNGETAALSGEEKKGFNLFTGKAKCATCHFVPLFNGLVPPQFTETESEVLGVPKSGNRKKLDDDEGKFNFTKSEIHKFSFKTPTLRNIELTAPYMHNGVFKTLDEVMKFYNKGGGKGSKTAPPNQTLPSGKLNLSEKEMKQVIAFLKTLTDTTYTYKGGPLN